MRSYLRVLSAVALALLTSGLCHASSVSLTSGLPNVGTSFGLLTGEQAYRLCMSRDIFVGEITSASSYWYPASDIDSRSIWSNATFQVQRDISDTLPSTRVVKFQGGKVGSVRSTVVDNPRAIVGARYLLGTTPVPKAQAHPLWPSGVEMLMVVSWLDPDADLPSEVALRSELSEVCAKVDIVR